MADYVLIVFTVFFVGFSAYHLGRLSMKDRYEFLLREIDDHIAFQTDQMLDRAKHPGLRVIKGE
jgi:hypothetical protein